MATTIGALRVELSANIAKFETAMGKDYRYDDATHSLMPRST